MWKWLLVTMALSGPGALANNEAPNLSALLPRDPAQSIQHLSEQCTASDLHDKMYCAGYISALTDHMWLLGGADTTRLLGICVKTSNSYGAAVQIFANWAQKHPEKWSLDRMYGVIWALQEVYPCK